MIITTGMTIRIEVGYTCLVKTADGPGRVDVITKEGTISLPGNPEEAARFIEAYQRIVNEDVAYRKKTVE